MKRLSTIAMVLFLGAGLALAQTGGDKKPLPPSAKEADNTKPNTKTTEKSGKKGHKGGKKGKKGSSGTTTPPPK